MVIPFGIIFYCRGTPPLNTHWDSIKAPLPYQLFVPLGTQLGNTHGDSQNSPIGIKLGNTQRDSKSSLNRTFKIVTSCLNYAFASDL